MTYAILYNILPLNSPKQGLGLRAAFYTFPRPEKYIRESNDCYCSEQNYPAVFADG